MHTTAQDLIRQTSELISLPDIYLRVSNVINDPDSSMIDLTDVVTHDPALTARLLKLANSPFFGFRTKIDTIHRAVNLLGSQQVHDLVLATSVADAFGAVSTNALSIDEFWIDSIHCGVLSKLLGEACGLVDADRFFVEGLLHDIGHLIMDQAVPEACTIAVQRAAQEHLPLFQVERDIIGCDYAEVGAALMESWHFPHGLVASVRWQNEPAAATDCALDAALIHIATCVVRADPPAEDTQDLSQVIAPHAFEITGADDDLIATARDTAAEHLTATVDSMFPDSRLCA